MVPMRTREVREERKKETVPGGRQTATAVGMADGTAGGTAGGTGVVGGDQWWGPGETSEGGGGLASGVCHRVPSESLASWFHPSRWPTHREQIEERHQKEERSISVHKEGDAAGEAAEVHEDGGECGKRDQLRPASLGRQQRG